MADYDGMGNINGTPMAAPEPPEQPQAQAKGPTAEQTREMQALLKVSGRYTGKVNGEPNKATDEALAKFQKDKGLDPAKAGTDGTLAALRDNIKNNPQALTNMKALAAQGGQDNAFAVEYALRAKEAFITPGGRTNPDGSLKSQTMSALSGIEKAQVAAAPVPTAPSAGTGAATESPAAGGQAGTGTPAVQAGGLAGMGGGMMGAIMQMLLPLLQMLLPGLMPLFMAISSPAQAAQAPKAPLPTAVTASQSQVRAVDNKLDAAAAKPAAATAPKPDSGTNTTTATQPESDEDRRARLGMTEKQYNGLLAEQSQWQADARTSGATGNSPFDRADRQDAMMQQKLGLDPIAWMALKKENKDWQTKVDAGDTALPKAGPIQQAYADVESKAALAAAPVAPKPESAPVATPTQERTAPQPQQRAYREQGPNGVETIVPAQYQQPAPVQSQARPPRNEGETSTQFNSASIGQERFNRAQITLQQRAEYRERGAVPELAKNYVMADRKQELINKGADPEIADQQAKTESREADIQEKGIMRSQSTYARQEATAMRQQQTMTAGEQRAYNTQVTQVSRDAGRVASIYSDNNPRNDSQANGIIVQRGVQELLGGGILRNIFGSNARGDSAPPATVQPDVNGWSRDAGRVANIYSDNNTRNDSQANGILVQRVVEGLLKGGIPGFSRDQPAQIYTAPQRGGYLPRDNQQEGFSYKSNQISPVQSEAANYGRTPDERAQILMDYHARQRQSLEATPAADNTSLANRDRQITGGFGGPS